MKVQDNKTSHIAVLSVYSSTPPAPAWAAAVFTLVKWLFAGLTTLLILIGFAMALINRFGRQPVKLARI